MNVPKIILTMLLTTSVLCAMDQQLVDASTSGNVELAQQLIEQQANVNARDGTGYFTPLMYAANGRHTEIAQLLIANQANVNARNYLRFTPLMLAVLQGYTDTAQLLIERQADVNAQDNYGWTPLMHAVNKGYEDTVMALLHAQADLSLQATSGRTALQLAKVCYQIKISKMIKRELARQYEAFRFIAQTLCAIRSCKDAILSAIPNELLFLILGHISPDGFERLLPKNHDQK
jgi:multidrug efflux pump subunit AcrA (membrane-fusion protein)